jgi:hypothetical protein
MTEVHFLWEAILHLLQNVLYSTLSHTNKATKACIQFLIKTQFYFPLPVTFMDDLYFDIYFYILNYLFFLYTFFALLPKSVLSLVHHYYQENHKFFLSFFILLY